MVFAPNNSPLSGRSGKAVTGRVIGERLFEEAETSVSLRASPVPGDNYPLSFFISFFIFAGP
jgi:predicted membrane GTPase involved in stress response